MVGMYSFRAFAGSKPSWMLSYSWEKEKQIVPAEAMKNLAAAQLTAGTNTWDVQGHVMSGSNDIETRKLIFGWIKEHEKTFFQPRQPVRPIGVYFSPKSRDYFAKEFIESYRGIMMLLLQSHLEFQIVTPRTLSDFHGDVLIFPDARCLGKEEVEYIRRYADSGKTLIITGETGKYDETGASRNTNPAHELLHITDPSTKKIGKKFIYYPQCPGKAYYAQLQKEFDQQAAAGVWGETTFNQLLKTFLAELLRVSGFKTDVQVDASPFLATQIASVDGKTSVFLANFKGLKSKEIAQQKPEENVAITFTTNKLRTIVFLPFLGQPQKIQGTYNGGKLICRLPPIEKNAVVWIE